MREIRFRVWDTVRKEWVHGPGNEPNLFGETILFGELLRRPDDTSVRLEELNDIIALQFTGLLDKNGKEIYEGDLLYSAKIQTDEEPPNDRWIVDVVFEDGSFCYGWHGDTLDKRECSIEMEVIGNIYENPELLKGD